MQTYLLVFFAAFVAAAVITPLAERLARRYDIMAMPGGRRRHSLPVPKLGGIPIMVAYLAGIAIIYWRVPPSGDDALRLQGVILGSLIVFYRGPDRRLS